MKGDILPPEDHLALHCQPKALEVDSDGRPAGINIEAFRVDDNGISMNWVEYEDGHGFDQKLCRTCKAIVNCRKVKRTHRIGLFVIAEIVSAGQWFGKSLQAIHDPVVQPINSLNLGHALVTGVVPSDSDLLEALTTLVELRSFPETAFPAA